MMIYGSMYKKGIFFSVKHNIGCLYETSEAKTTHVNANKISNTLSGTGDCQSILNSERFLPHRYIFSGILYSTKTILFIKMRKLIFRHFRFDDTLSVAWKTNPPRSLLLIMHEFIKLKQFRAIVYFSLLKLPGRNCIYYAKVNSLTDRPR